MERRCLLVVGGLHNDKLHHVLEIGLNNALLRRIKAMIALEGCWTGWSDVMDNIVWWRITDAGAIRVVGVL